MLASLAAPQTKAALALGHFNLSPEQTMQYQRLMTILSYNRYYGKFYP